MVDHDLNLRTYYETFSNDHLEKCLQRVAKELSHKDDKYVSHYKKEQRILMDILADRELFNIVEKMLGEPDA